MNVPEPLWEFTKAILATCVIIACILAVATPGYLMGYRVGEIACYNISRK
jgi:hypothetical protein